MQANFDITNFDVAEAMLPETGEILCLDGTWFKTLLGK